MKRVLSVLLSLTMLLMLLPAVAAGDGTGLYTVSLNGKCEDDGTASVFVFVSSDTEKTYNAFWLTLAYDDSALEFVGADNVVPQLVIAVGAPDEVRRVEDAKGGVVKYYRTEDNVHVVPKRPLSELII